MEYPIEYYNCHKFGHITKFCRNIFTYNYLQDRGFESMRQNRIVQETLCRKWKMKNNTRAQT